MSTAGVRNVELVPRGGGGEGRGRGSGNGCWKCGKEGHRAFECSSLMVCFKCNRTGHIAVECVTPQCTACGKAGHTEATCWNLHPQQKFGARGGRGRGNYRGRGGGYGRGRGRGANEYGKEQGEERKVTFSTGGTRTLTPMKRERG